MEQILGPLLHRAAQQLGDAQHLQRALRAVLGRAARRAFGVGADVQVDVGAGAITVMVFRRVVERPASPEEIDLAQARAIDDAAELGDELGCAMALDALGPYLRGALVVPAEQYAPLHALLVDLMWDRDVLDAVSSHPAESGDPIGRLVQSLRDGSFAAQLRPGCDSVELEAHEMMLGRPLPKTLRALLSGVGGMDDGPGAPRLGLGAQGYRLLSPSEAQREHAEWTARHDEPPSGPYRSTDPAAVWDVDWLPVAVGSRGAEPTTLLVIDPLGSAAARPGELLGVSFEEAGWWKLGVDLAGLAHVWHTLAEHDLLEHVVPGLGDPVEVAKADAMVEHLLPERRWVDAR